MDLSGWLLAAGCVFVSAVGGWLFYKDWHASRLASLRPQPLRRKQERFVLPAADDTRLSVARFRRVIGEWALLEERAESLARRADALRRRGLL